MPPPHIERTPFTPQEPPTELTLYFCPACGTVIRDSYDIEPARKRCTRRIHLAEAVGYRYSRAGEWARLLHAAAAALERTQVDDPGEATMILEKVVRLDGSYVPADAA